MSKRKSAQFIVQEQDKESNDVVLPPSDLLKNIRSSMSKAGRSRANILICGTPGSGKSTLCQQLLQGMQQDSFHYFPISELVKEKGWTLGRDDVLDTYIMDEDKVCKGLKKDIKAGGCLVDFHGCDLFPETWFDLVIVLRVDNTVLYDRLLERQYSPAKITENVECEIMQVILEEARAVYPLNHIELVNDTLSQSKKHCQFILSLLG